MTGANAIFENKPALVLNADFRPLSYYPLSLWSWQDTVKAVFLDRVNIVSEYDSAVHSPSFEMRLPSVVSLKTYVKPALYPAFTRFNVFLRDRFSCQYCGSGDDLTFRRPDLALTATPGDPADPGAVTDACRAIAATLAEPEVRPATAARRR